VQADIAPVAAAGLSCAEHEPRLRFRFPGTYERCLRHAVFYPRLRRTAFFTALVVGTVLTAINQGTVLATGEFPSALGWKIPLTYCVPYCVATFAALRVALVRKDDSHV
jgi:hypothetical protein